MVSKVTTSLAENLITLACYDDDHGRLVVGMIEPDLFEGDYRIIAERALAYWKRYGHAPHAHTPDLVADIIDDPKNKKAQTYKRILSSMVQLADGMNRKYVVDQISKFVRAQELKEAIHSSAEQISASGEQSIDEIERIWQELLRKRKEVHFNPGTRLSDYEPMLAYVEQTQTEFRVGIKELDRKGIVPMRGTSTLLIGASGKGKSWALIQYARMALGLRKKVLHISLEMSEVEVQGRYYQSIFAIPKRMGDVVVQKLVTKRGKLVDILEEVVTPEWSLTSPHVRDELGARILQMGGWMNNLIIKQFGSMTMQQFEAYLDALEVEEGFIPDLIVLDYFGLVNVGTSARDFRLAMGNAYKTWRGVLIDRSMAGVTAQQSSKEGAEARTIKSRHVAEDWSLIATSDFALTLSATDMESNLGLMRGYVAKGRSETDKFSFLLSQSFKIGQFALKSAMLHADYYEMVKDIEEEKGSDGDE